MLFVRLLLNNYKSRMHLFDIEAGGRIINLKKITLFLMYWLLILDSLYMTLLTYQTEKPKSGHVCATSTSSSQIHFRIGSNQLPQPDLTFSTLTLAPWGCACVELQFSMSILSRFGMHNHIGIEWSPPQISHFNAIVIEKIQVYHIESGFHLSFEIWPDHFHLW
jgi:hypothetical protein